MKTWWLWIVAAAFAIFFGIRMYLKGQSRTKIIRDWSDANLDAVDNVRRLEKLSKAQQKEAIEELKAIDDKYKAQKDELDEEIRNDQRAIANAWNNYFSAKRARMSSSERKTGK